MPEKKDLNVLIGTNIRQAREAAGYTQEKFSEMIGIGPKSLSAIECGTVGISLAALKRVCSTLSVSSRLDNFRAHRGERRLGADGAASAADRGGVQAMQRDNLQAA